MKRAILILSLAVLLLSMTSTPTALAQTDSVSYTIVDTGQLYCYDDNEYIPFPEVGEEFYGQDAQYNGNLPSYQNNGDGTVTDLNTGLMWQQSPEMYDLSTHSEAMSDADSFKLAGYDDWRLPTIKELFSLIDFQGSTFYEIPYIDTDYFEFRFGNESLGERFIDAQYWSSTVYVSTTMGGDITAFGVNFADGRIKGYPTEVGPDGSPKECFVRYVRGNPDYGINDFVDNDDGTITDEATGLMWATDDSGYGMYWESALLWVQQMNDHNYLGYNDWRLPNAKELQSIVDYARSPDTTSSAAIDPLFNVTIIEDEGGNTNYPFFWTSTTHLDGPNADFAVYIAFGEALGYMSTPSGTELLDVHGAGAQRSDPKSGDPADWPSGNGPQGDVVRIDNFVRLVRGGIAEQETDEPTYTEPTPPQQDLTIWILAGIGGIAAFVVVILVIRRLR
jgi:hypothetical protein